MSKQVYDIETIVGRCFIRIIKNHNNYPLFKKRFLQIQNKDGNPFGQFYDYNSFIQNLSKVTQKEVRRESNRYEFVTMMINHLLHYFLEKGGIPPQRLNSYGQEIFDLSCYTAWGDEFIRDMEAMKKQMGGKMQIPENIDPEVMMLYVQRRRNGDNVTIEQVLDEWNAMHSNNGHWETPFDDEEGEEGDEEYYDVDEAPW